MDNVRISVIVAVYNRESTLDRCIDSLVYQTFDGIEIILVDDQSTDSSMDILQRWQGMFPDKIVILRNPNKGVAHAKNMGISHAQGQYLAFVDSDDYVDYKMFERLYNCAEQNNYPEIVTSPIWSISGNKKWKRGVMSKAEECRDYLELEAYFLPGKLINKRLFVQFGLLPELGIGEDVSWMFPAISHTERLAYSAVPGYYYELSPNSISINDTSYELIKDVIKGSERIIQETNPQYAEEAKIYAYKRIVSLSKNKTAFCDFVEQYFLDHMDEIKSIPGLEHRAPGVYQMMLMVEQQQEMLPKHVYVSGFIGNHVCPDRMDVFQGEMKVTVLDAKKLDRNQCPDSVWKAYQSNNFDFVLGYLALRACYENGGVFIDRDIVVDYPFNSLLKDPAFFGFESDERFTDKVFGCQAGNLVFKRILQTYEMPQLYEDEFAPLKQRIKTVLVGMGNIRMCSGIVRKPEYGFCVYPVDTFVYSLPYAENLHLCHYKPEAFGEIEGGSVPIKVLQSLSDRRVRLEVDKEKRATRAANKEIARYKGLADKRSEYILRLEREQKVMLNSWSWRVSKPVRVFGSLVRKVRRFLM